MAFDWKWVCALLLPGAAAIGLPAQTVATLASFNGTNGANPQYMALIQGIDGNLYGVAPQGGANGFGTIFKITQDGTLTAVYSFLNSSDGAYPYGGLVQTTDGLFYGTTAGLLYGTNGGQDTNLGTVFKVTPSGTLTTLHTFEGSDGAFPYGTLLQAGNGAFYGTTESGGSSDGTVFRIAPNGTFASLYHFSGSDGWAPIGALAEGPGGDIFGTTMVGGNAHDNAGTIFKIAPDGVFTTLHIFARKDGAGPTAGLVLVSNGAFYGTTQYGGPYDQGEIFRITPAGDFKALRSLYGTLGSYPAGALVQATDGNLYGINGFANIFKITPAGAYSVLYNFDEAVEPAGTLLQATDGNFYGISSEGGDNNLGTVFKLSVGLGPFVKTLPASGKVGATVKVLGTNLTSVTSVTFNGTPASFTSAWPSAISTVVPAGATTGAVQVVSSGGTLSSNVAFRVLQ